MTASRRAALALLLATGFAAVHAAPASAPRARAAAPAANFLVEWRIRPTRTAAANGGIVIGTRDAATGASGFGAGSTVVGTAPAAVAQGVRVANGKEAALSLDTASRRTVYDLAWSDATDGTRGSASHEVTLHRIQGLRVTPHWTRGDTLALDLQLVQAGPDDADAEGRATRAVDFRSTLQLSFDEWQGVARVGDAGDELQVRISWR